MSKDPHKISFDVNCGKAVESVLYILSKKPTVNMYNVLKTLFEADKRHLNLHGRPVTGDTYIHMKWGTVPSFVYDLIKRDPLAMMELGFEAVPFERVGPYDLKALRAPNLDLLSESDIESLDQGLKEYLDLSFDDVEKKNHEERCWKETELNQPIAFELMIENTEILDYLRTMPFKQAI